MIPKQGRFVNMTVLKSSGIKFQEFVLEKRKKTAEALKEDGNVEFRAGRFQRAAELYTSAILEYDQDQVSFFTS